MTIVRASSSLPFVCPIIPLDGVPMLDGGIVDSIPLKHAMEDGFTNNIVVLTRNQGYRKKEKKRTLPKFVYRKYPELREDLANRCCVYNRQLDLVEKLEDEGKIIVIRPQKPVVVDRIEKDIQKLTDLYEEGYAVAKTNFES
jgi:predicted patatin/cPLA2 family phospholipase